MLRVARILALTGFMTLLIPGCRGEADSNFYSIDAPPVRIAEGATGSIDLAFKARPGYKWNSEFPARFQVLETGNLSFDRQEFTSARKDFKDLDGIGNLSIPFGAGLVGRTEVKALAGFSVCNDNECRIFRDIPIEVEVNVQ